MDIKQYIESGILEVYLLRELPEEELRKAEALIAAHDTLKEELTKIEYTLEVLFQRAAIMPDEAVKKQLIKKVQLQEKARRQEVEAHLLPIPAFWSRYGVAACIFLLTSLMVSLYFYIRLQQIQSKLGQALEQNQVVLKQYDNLHHRYQAISQYLSIISDPAFQQLGLQGTASSSENFATVFWNQDTGEVYLNISGLPAPKASRQYQLWAIDQGKPVNAGLVVEDENNNFRLIRMKKIHRASAFAITLEPAGGSEEPTLKALAASGEVPEGSR